MFCMEGLESLLRELTRMFRAHADTSALESIAMIADMATPTLLQDTPPQIKSNGAHHASRSSIETMNSDIQGLMDERRTIQHSLNSQHNQSHQT